ncbi:disulfide bond formation protein B [Biformimicrobium ophioploci]|uniref:Disulfide bond formation protein B n=1 Tax=Biformimicrobium ophioploci TaxID=3036711 RepID=A0ABQ6LVT9_9GAMM|nr:disulfide bond formation protein B [Microbulbifer sp. NKW57]GMG86198.1 disulfide bond formation protein B [Microbulbifer sp. NKW57]
MSLPGPRAIFALLFAGCAFLISAAMYLEYVEGLEPCPLCLTQRIMVILVGVVALVAALHNPGASGRRAYGLLVSLFAAGGLYFAGRQLWLQSLPADQVPACGPGVSYMFEAFPFLDFLKVILTGDGNCAEVKWTFLGLSIPGWAAVGFVGLFALGLWQAFRKTR